MANSNDPQSGAPPREIHVEDKKELNWLAWLALAAGLLALLYFLTRDREPAMVVTNTTDTFINDTSINDTGINDTGMNTGINDPGLNASDGAMGGTTMRNTGGLGAYLGGTEATPRTFNFEKLNFDTAKSEVRAADQAELAAIAASLKQYATTKIRVVGYADARGVGTANAALGKARADSVKAALVKTGIDASRIETASGGEADPVDTNATQGGQAENRRTELTVLSR